MTNTTKRESKDEAKKAVQANSNMHVLAAIRAICENSLLRGPTAQNAARRIIAICDKEAQQQWRLYDIALIGVSDASDD